VRSVAAALVLLVVLVRWQLAATAVRRRGTGAPAPNDEGSAEAFGFVTIVGGSAGACALLAGALGMGSTGRWWLAAAGAVAGIGLVGALSRRFPRLVLPTLDGWRSDASALLGRPEGRVGVGLIAVLALVLAVAAVV
jgi:hypothetical protein